MKTKQAGISALPVGIIAYLYTIITKDGTEFRLTSCDIDLAYGGHTYLANRVISHGTIKSSAGVEVDTCDLIIHRTNEADSIISYAINGGFDWAKVKIERARNEYVVWMFEGIVADAPSLDRIKVTIAISDPKVLLNIDMPRNVYSVGCIWNLYGTGCGKNKADFASFGTVASGSTKRSIKSNLTDVDDWFTLGMITFTSGLNIGLSRTVKDHFNTDGRIVLSVQFPFNPSAGDTFTIYAGCDKSQPTCTTKFSNLSNFRGFPFMPVPEESV
jgi:uncharacterized phage protein (TIGR02218 family)